MTSAQIRQSFLDFFREKQHTIVPSSSLLPDAPNLLFTNAGMNQFVPIFLGQQKPLGTPPRVADTQKCIRAGGKHNDLEDVGLDTYHHTFFEMLGNWSFGDYFKKEAIEWAWELVVDRWKFPAQRLYATVYKPGPNEPSEFDQEAYDHWTRMFQDADLDPNIHVLTGGKADNFWMMGDTGPCGPCSELHVDLTPDGDTRGALVNKNDPRCFEIWNLVFIQFNANADGTFTALPQRHVDTGMGFERVTAIIQGTKNLMDFSGAISNYETDIFRPIFDELEKLSGKKYASTLPDRSQPSTLNPQLSVDIAFRVIADHIRTLSFAIADGIIPSNEGRGYVLRRVLRRAVRYGRTLGFHEPFFFKLVDVVARTMGDVFPEVRAKQKQIKETIKREEESFNKTLDTGLLWFHRAANFVEAGVNAGMKTEDVLKQRISGEAAFKLFDTYGFPLDLTELMARERGLNVDVAGFERLMEEQRDRARKAQKKSAIEISRIDGKTPTHFLGYEEDHTGANVEAIVDLAQRRGVILNNSVCYAEMGGQVGDTGMIEGKDGQWRIANTQRSGATSVHVIENDDTPGVGEHVTVKIDIPRRRAIERHHTVTHLLHWALHEVVSPDAVQKGSYVGPDKLTFDFSSAALSPQQVADVERLANATILENSPVTGTEVKYDHIKNRKDIMQFFGEKYGDWVRVVQIGGNATALDGYSMELCGGTHVRATGEIGLFRIVAESATGAGIRRIEAVAGLEAYKQANEQLQLIKTLAGKINTPVTELEKKVESLLAQQKDLEKQLKSAQQKQPAETPRTLTAKPQTTGSTRAIIEKVSPADGDFLQSIAD